MSKISIKEKYKNGDIIMMEGSFGEGTYVVLEGNIEVYKTINNERVNIAHLGKGDVFGEMSFIDRQPRTASIVAVGDVQVGLIDKDFLENEINKTSEDFRIIMRALTERLRKTTGELVNLKIGCHGLDKK